MSVREGVCESSLTPSHTYLPCVEDCRVLAALSVSALYNSCHRAQLLFSSAGARAGLPQCELPAVCCRQLLCGRMWSCSSIARLMVLMRTEPG